MVLLIIALGWLASLALFVVLRVRATRPAAKRPAAPRTAASSRPRVRHLRVARTSVTGDTRRRAGAVGAGVAPAALSRR